MDYALLATLYEIAVRHGVKCTCGLCRKFVKEYLKAMDLVRAEVIWEILTLSQRIALKNSLNNNYHFDPKERWSKLTPGQQEALLKIDWEFSLGVRFPQLNSKKEK